VLGASFTTGSSARPLAIAGINKSNENGITKAYHEKQVREALKRKTRHRIVACRLAIAFNNNNNNNNNIIIIIMIMK
jgi:hypothetical protein